MTKEEFEALENKRDAMHYGKVEFDELAKGLMIGDYYTDRSKGVYKRVTLNTFHKIMVRYGDLHIGTEPIMLTKDMLERNGFHIDNGVASKYWGGTNDGVVFDYMVTCDYCMDDVVKYIHIRAPHIGIGMPLSEVNEFLHALRLSGLVEMADGFEL